MLMMRTALSVFPTADGAAKAIFLLKAFEKPEETIKTLPQESAELAGTLVEFEQVGHALLAVFQSTAEREISGLFVEFARAARRPAACWPDRAIGAGD